MSGCSVQVVSGSHSEKRYSAGQSRPLGMARVRVTFWRVLTSLTHPCLFSHSCPKTQRSRSSPGGHQAWVRGLLLAHSHFGDLTRGALRPSCNRQKWEKYHIANSSDYANTLQSRFSYKNRNAEHSWAEDEGKEARRLAHQQCPSLESRPQLTRPTGELGRPVSCSDLRARTVAEVCPRGQP